MSLLFFLLLLLCFPSCRVGRRERERIKLALYLPTPAAQNLVLAPSFSSMHRGLQWDCNKHDWCLKVLEIASLLNIGLKLRCLSHCFFLKRCSINFNINYLTKAFFTPLCLPLGLFLHVSCFSSFYRLLLALRRSRGGLPGIGPRTWLSRPLPMPPW